jgi:hypothetical protein
LDRHDGAPGQDGLVRRTVPYLAAWFAAGAVAVTVASAAVAVVGDPVTDGRQAPLSAEQVRELAAAAEATTTTTAGPSVTTTTTTTPPSTTPTTVGGGPTVRPGTSPATTTTTPRPPPIAVTRTYNLVGGTATLRFGPAGVQVVAAVPNPGFSVDVSEAHGTGARVEFEDDDHRSRVDGWWDGTARDEVREDD